MIRKVFLVLGVLSALCGNSFVSALFGRNSNICQDHCVPGDESIMKEKEHGTSHVPVQDNLRWGCESKLADRICNFNRHYAGMRFVIALNIFLGCGKIFSSQFVAALSSLLPLIISFQNGLATSCPRRF
jgi:hypothetical protein